MHGDDGRGLFDEDEEGDDTFEEGPLLLPRLSEGGGRFEGLDEDEDDEDPPLLLKPRARDVKRPL